jgi:hypothetical protein
MTPGTQYTISIIPTIGSSTTLLGGGSGSPTTITVTLAPILIPASASITSTSAVVSFNGFTSTGAVAPIVLNPVTFNPPLTYNYNCYTGAQTALISTSSNTVTVTGLVPGSLYTFTVTPVVGAQQFTKYTTSFTTLPGAITFNPVTNLTDKTFILTWSALPNIVSYSYSITTGFSTSNLITGSITTASNSPLQITNTNITGILPGTLYTISVTPISSAGSGTLTTRTITTTPSAFTTPPTTGTPTTTSFTISWESVPGATKYNYTITPTPPSGAIVPASPIIAVATGKINQTFSGLSPGTRYTITIIPVVTGTPDVLGTPVTIYPITLPTAITGLTSTSLPSASSSTSLSYTWPNDNGTDNYLIRVSSTPPVPYVINITKNSTNTTAVISN